MKQRKSNPLTQIFLITNYFFNHSRDNLYFLVDTSDSSQLKPTFLLTLHDKIKIFYIFYPPQIWQIENFFVTLCTIFRLANVCLNLK